jgi:hypothetical protein
MYSLLRFLSYLFISTILILSCGDETPNPGYALYPIDLKLTELSNGWRYEWTKTKARDFDSYWVVRTEGDTVPYLQDNNVNLLRGNSEIVKVVTNVDSTTFYDTISIVNKNANVRIFSFLGDRTLSSVNKTVKANSNMASVPVNTSEFVYDNVKKRVVGIDRIKNIIGVYDLNNNRESNPKVPSINIGFSNLTFTDLGEIAYGSSNFGNEVYIPGRNANFIILNLDNGTFTPSISFFVDRSFFIYKSYVITGNQSSLNSIFRVTNNSFQFTGSFSQSSSFSGAAFFLRPFPNKKEFLAVKETPNGTEFQRINYSNLDNATGVSNPTVIEKSFLKFNFKITPKPFVISKDGNMFITSEEGILSDIKNQKSINLSKKITGRTHSYINFHFSDDGSLIYGLRNNRSNQTENRVDVFNYPEGNFVKSIPLRIKAEDFFIDNNELIIVGRAPSTLEKSFIERIKL